MGRKQRRGGKHLYFFLAGNIIALIFICGCTHFYEGFVVKPDFMEADDLVKAGNYNASLLKYEQIMVQYPSVGDRALFEMGLIYASSQNQQKDYQKSLDCFQKLIKDYPKSRYKQNSDVIISLINEVISSDKKLIAQQIQIDTLEQNKKVIVQQKQIDSLEQKVEKLEKKIEQIKNVDMNLIHKKKPIH
ncbi:MAG: tetratricopeptide repeat protein [Syntrophaceae bacterium]